MTHAEIAQNAINEHLGDGCVRDHLSNYAPEIFKHQWLWDAPRLSGQSLLNLTAAEIIAGCSDERSMNPKLSGADAS